MPYFKKHGDLSFDPIIDVPDKGARFVESVNQDHFQPVSQAPNQPLLRLMKHKGLHGRRPICRDHANCGGPKASSF